MWFLIACFTSPSLRPHAVSEGFGVPPPPGAQTLVLHEVPGVVPEGTVLRLYDRQGALLGDADVVLDEGSDVYVYVSTAVAQSVLRDTQIWMQRDPSRSR